MLTMQEQVGSRMVAGWSRGTVIKFGPITGWMKPWVALAASHPSAGHDN